MVAFPASIFAFLCGGLVTALASSLTGREVMPFAGWAGMAAQLADVVWVSLLFVVTGFSGVFAGAMTLPLSSRVRGAAILGILGLAFTSGLFIWGCIVTSDEPDEPIPWQNLVPLIWVLTMLATGAATAGITMRKGWLGAKTDPATFLMRTVYGKPEDPKKDPY